MTGAISNVHPPHYGEEPSTDHEPYDHVRDRTTLKLLRRVVDRGMPLFCICRGFQELNVALGGTLEAELQRGHGRLDHRGEKSDDTDVRYKLSHRIDVVAGGMLERILGKREAIVNSVHRQGIRKLASSLAAEAIAPDGIIEAVSIKGAKGFAFGTQWHPEYKACPESGFREAFRSVRRCGARLPPCQDADRQDAVEIRHWLEPPCPMTTMTMSIRSCQAWRSGSKRSNRS